MKRYKHFGSFKEAVDYIAYESVCTLEDDHCRMNERTERQHYTDEDRRDVRGKLHDVRLAAARLPEMLDTLATLADMKTEEEYEDGDAPPSEDWISTLSEMIMSARHALGHTRKEA